MAVLVAGRRADNFSRSGRHFLHGRTATPAQGQTFGIGYRRSDLFHDALNVRATVRGSLAGALLVDGEVQINNLGRSPDTFVTFYSKYERSPHMEFYGIGRDSRMEDRTRYLLETVTEELRAGLPFHPEHQRRRRNQRRIRAHRPDERRRRPLDRGRLRCNDSPRALRRHLVHRVRGLCRLRHARPPARPQARWLLRCQLHAVYRPVGAGHLQPSRAGTRRPALSSVLQRDASPRALCERQVRLRRG